MSCKLHIIREEKCLQVIILIIYVDDIFVMGNDMVEMERVKKRLHSEFEIKDLGKLRYFPYKPTIL